LGEVAQGSSWLSWIFTGFGTIFSVGVIALYWFQDKLLYFPQMPPGSKTQFISPRDYGLQEFVEEVFFRTPDGLRLQGWFVKHSSTTSHEVPTMLCFHGNAGNISHRLPNMKYFRERLGCNVFYAAYRGYGKSEGIPTEAGLKKDAQAALEYLLARPDVDSNKIFVYGDSLGGAVSIYLGASNQDKLKAIIVENTFTSILDMIDVVFPVLNYVKFLSSNRWESIELVKNITIPILFISGLRDELVPPSQMQRLYDTAASPRKKLLTFPKGQHMDTWLQPGYHFQFKEFVDNVFA